MWVFLKLLRAFLNVWLLFLRHLHTTFCATIERLRNSHFLNARPMYHQAILLSPHANREHREVNSPWSPVSRPVDEEDNSQRHAGLQKHRNAETFTSCDPLKPYVSPPCNAPFESEGSLKSDEGLLRQKGDIGCLCSSEDGT